MPFRFRVDQDDGENDVVYDKQDVDKLLSRDLNKLSLQERETVFEQIHVVDQVVDENEKLIQQSLAELSRELDSIQSKPAYDMAISTGHASKEYVTSRKFRLLFLRCENFVVKKAAKRLVLFMENVLEFFGPNALGRPLLYKDLGEEAQKYLKTGVLQMVHGARDTTGRAIFCHHYLQDEKIPKLAQAMVRIFEKQSIIKMPILLLLHDGLTNFAKHMNSEAVRVRNWLPIKFPVQHACFNDPVMHVWAPLVYAIIPRDMRQRFKLHDGTHIECMYELRSFGIPVGKLPLDYYGNTVHKEHDDWIERRKLLDLEVTKPSLPAMRNANQIDKDDNDTIKETSSGRIETPAQPDVALCRGRIYQLHPGNVRMRQLIDQFRDEYDAAPRNTGIKVDIAMRIVSIVKIKDKGRFLTKDSDSSGSYWIEVPNDEAQKRVSKAFRSARKSTATKTTTVTIKNGPKRLRLDTASPPTTGILSAAIPTTMDGDGCCGGGGCPRKLTSASPQNALLGTRSLL